MFPGVLLQGRERGRLGVRQGLRDGWRGVRQDAGEWSLGNN